MNIPKPVLGRFEFNLNTLLQMITLFGVVIGGAAIWTNTSRDIQELKDWRAGHNQLHKERNAELSAVAARAEERFRGIEAKLSRQDQLEYRLTVSEQSTINVADSVKNLQEIVNRQGSDIRLALEILQRMESRINPSQR